MKKLTAIFLLAFFVLPLFLPQKATYADAGPVYLYGVNIVPYHENSIELTKEDLSIDFTKNNSFGEGRADVYAKFVFFNTGDKITLKMGFPFRIAEERGNIPFPSDVAVKVNGKTIKVNRITTETSKYDPWIYFDVSFDRGETKTVEVGYTAIPLEGYFMYVLNTGALWKGPIGTLDIRMKFPYKAVYPYVLSVKPLGYTAKGNEIFYHLTNFEPTSDIKVEFLPPGFYEKILPLKEKAEKTNNATDWFNYALALFPRNPLGELEEFVARYKTSAFKEYLLDVSNKAMGMQKEESAEYRILREIYDAHFSSYERFHKGYNSLVESSNGYYTFPDSVLTTFGNDIEAPQSKLEGRIIGYALEYAVFANLKNNDSNSAIKHFNTLLDIADKYFDEADYNPPAVPIELSGAMNPKWGIVRPESVAPPFDECFLPSVKIEDNTVFISYILPSSMKSALTNVDLTAGKTANFYLKAETEKVPPYRYIVTITLPSANEKDFNASKELLIQNVKQSTTHTEKSEGRDAYKFISVYLSDILNNITLKNGKVMRVSSYVDCSTRIENALKNLDNEMGLIKERKGKSPGSFSDSIISYLSYNKSYFDYAKENPKIVFEMRFSIPAKSSSNKNLIIILLSAAIIVLLAVVIVLLKIKTMPKKS